MTRGADLLRPLQDLVLWKDDGVDLVSRNAESVFERLDVLYRDTLPPPFSGALPGSVCEFAKGEVTARFFNEKPVRRIPNGGAVSRVDAILFHARDCTSEGDVMSTYGAHHEV